MPEESASRLSAVIEGRVQGVGFRFFVQEAAQSLGLTGWVRNRWDDSVEVVAEGQKEALNQLLTHLQRGPRSAFVSNVRTDWSSSTGEFSDFRVRRTE